MDPVIAQAKRCDLDSGLRQILDGTVVVNRMIGSLGGDQDRRDIRKIDKAPRRRLL
jgi:hypothetical protein